MWERTRERRWPGKGRWRGVVEARRLQARRLLSAAVVVVVPVVMAVVVALLQMVVVVEVLQ